MLPGETGNDKLIVRKPRLDFPDVYNRVLGVPEVLLPILRYVVLGEEIRENILRIASVSHLWRKVVYDILQSSGTPVYEFKCDMKAMSDWGECFLPGKTPLGYILPVGLVITDYQVFQQEIQGLICRHSERVIRLQLFIFRSDLRLLHILESFKLKNLVSLTLSFPECGIIWPEDSVRTVQSIMKVSPKLKYLSLDWEHPGYFGHSYSPCVRWLRQTLDTKLESRLVADWSDWRLEKLHPSIDKIDWSPVFEWILRLSAPRIRELEIIFYVSSNRKILLPDTLGFPKLTTLRLVRVLLINDTVAFDTLQRLPSLKFLHIHDTHASATTLFDQFFPEPMRILPMIQAFTYEGADLSASQCSSLIRCLPNCIKLGIEWHNADCANKSIRQITRNMTQLKILEVYLSGHSPNEFAEHIDDWTFAGLESAPEVPKLERITIHTKYPESLTRNILRNVPTRIPNLTLFQILKQGNHQVGHGANCRCPVYRINEEVKCNSA